MKKTFFRQSLLPMLLICFLTISCQDDYINDSSRASAKESVSRQILRNREARENIDELIVLLKKKNLKISLGSDSNNPLSRTTYDDIASLIDYKEVLEIKQPNGIMNSTYRVANPRSVNNVFYNLVVKKAGATQKIVLLEYTLDSNFLKEYYSGTKDFKMFSGTISYEVLSVDDGYPCEEEPNQPVPVHNGAGAGLGGGATPPTTIPIPPGATGGTNSQLVIAQHMYLIVEAINNESDNTPIHEGQHTPGDEETTEGSQGVRPHYNLHSYKMAAVETDEPNPCAEAQEIGILDPNGEVTDEENCESLNNMMQDQQIKNSFNYVKDKATNSNQFFREWGFSFRDDANPVELQLASNSINTLNVPTGPEIYGASHSHPDQFEEGFIPMFSLSDVAKLGRIAAAYVPSHGSEGIKDCVLTLTVRVHPNGETETYAIKISNYFQFIGWSNNKTSKYIYDKGVKYERLYNKAKRFNPSMENYLKTFFKMLESEGINGVSVFKANSDLSSWSKITYNKNNNGISFNPCN